MKEIYVEIGGFVIRIILGKKTLDPHVSYLINKLEIELLIYLRGFIVQNKRKRFDFEIEFEYIKEPGVLSLQNEDKIYIPIFQKVTDKKFKTYYNLNTSQLELILKYALLSLLKKNSGFGIHASVAKVNGKAYLFLGESGAGKSTIVELIKEVFPTINDDMTFIRKINSEYCVFQTPFSEKPWWINKSKKFVKVNKIIFIHKSRSSDSNKINDKKIIAKRVLGQVMVAQHLDSYIIKNVTNFTNFIQNFYDLNFEKDVDKTISLVSKLK